MFIELCTFESKKGFGGTAFFAYYWLPPLIEVYLVTYAVCNDPVCSSDYIEKNLMFIGPCIIVITEE